MRMIVGLCILCGFFGPVLAAETTASSYTVKSGDWLEKIAKQHNVSWQQLATVNKLKNANLIFPGQTIIVPNAPVASLPQKAEVAAETNQTPHVVVACAQDETPTEVGIASWYGAWHHGKITASGEPFNMNELTVAHPSLPFGTIVCVSRGGKSALAKVNDRGPFVRPRVIDLSFHLALHLGLAEYGGKGGKKIVGPGIGEVSISILEIPNKKWTRPKTVLAKSVRKGLDPTQSANAEKVRAATVSSVVQRDFDSPSPNVDEPYWLSRRQEIRRFLTESIGPPYDMRLLEDAMMKSEMSQMKLASLSIPR